MNHTEIFGPQYRSNARTLCGTDRAYGATMRFGLRSSRVRRFAAHK